MDVVVTSGVRPQQRAPHRHRGLGFLNVLQEREFAVIPPPTAGLEQFSEVLKPSLGESAPARNQMAAPRHVYALCHKSARKKENGRDATNRRIIGRDPNILWKTFSDVQPLATKVGQKHGEIAPSGSTPAEKAYSPDQTAQNPAKNKDPPGGNTTQAAPLAKRSKINANRFRSPADQGLSRMNMDRTGEKIDTPLTRPGSPAVP